MTRPGGIFADSSGRRWNRFWLNATLSLLALLALVLAFVQTLLVTPNLLSPGQSANPGAKLQALIAAEESHATFRPPQWLVDESASQPPRPGRRKLITSTKTRGPALLAHGDAQRRP